MATVCCLNGPTADPKSTHHWDCNTDLAILGQDEYAKQRWRCRTAMKGQNVGMIDSHGFPHLQAGFWVWGWRWANGTIVLLQPAFLDRPWKQTGTRDYQYCISYDIYILYIYTYIYIRDISSILVFLNHIILLIFLYISGPPKNEKTPWRMSSLWWTRRTSWASVADARGAQSGCLVSMAMGVSIVIAVWMVYFMDNPSKYSKWDTSVSCLGDPKVWSILPTASRSIMAWTCWWYDDRIGTSRRSGTRNEFLKW
jgi:hypothetical protein